MCSVVMTYLIVGKFERSKLTQQQVGIYVNEVNNKRKDLLQKYIQMSNEAKVLLTWLHYDISRVRPQTTC